MKTKTLILVFFVVALLGFSEIDNTPGYKNPKHSAERRLEDLIARMTLEEKAAQLQNYHLQHIKFENKIIGREGIGGIGYERYESNPAPELAAKEINAIQKFLVDSTRLGIPAIIHGEALHGVCSNGFTIFPQAIGMASTWDLELMSQVANAISAEAKTIGIRQVLSPVLNVARDVRWGRTEETYGEDPYLISRMGVAFCKAFEEKGIVTTPKHFVANFGDGGRESFPPHLSERILREVYFPGFKACITEAGSRSLMPAYNSFDGIPCHTSEWLLQDILRGEWGFEGYVVSDYAGLNRVYVSHGTAANPVETAAQGIKAGMNRELPKVSVYGTPLVEAVRNGFLNEEDLDQAVRDVLKVKFELGLFENPYIDPQVAGKIPNSSKHRQIALEAARKSIVLLKNDKTLPINQEIKKILVTGPIADEAKTGGYSGWGVEKISILDGIQNHAPEGVSVEHLKVGTIDHIPLPAIDRKYFVDSVKASYFANREVEGEPEVIKREDDLHIIYHGRGPVNGIPEREPFSVRYETKIKAPYTQEGNLSLKMEGGARLYVDGKLILDLWNSYETNKIIPFSFEKGRIYDVRLEYRSRNENGFVSLGWDILPFSETDAGKAVKASENADAIVFVAGISEGEQKDRANLNLSVSQEKIINELAKTDKPLIVMLMNGSAVTMENWIASANAIVEYWYAGEEGGNAMGEILFGKCNPSGKLPITFPVSVAQLPLYYNYKPLGRGSGDYLDMSGKPQFPFGHGLSYTNFEYSNIKLDKDTIRIDEDVDVKVTVKNTGKFDGDEVVQMYINDVYASTSRPIKELKGFKRIHLRSREEKMVTLTIKPEHLAVYDKNMKYVVEPGDFKIMIGSSSEDIRSISNLNVSG